MSVDRSPGKSPKSARTVVIEEAVVSPKVATRTIASPRRTQEIIVEEPVRSTRLSRVQKEEDEIETEQAEIDILQDQIRELQEMQGIRKQEEIQEEESSEEEEEDEEIIEIRRTPSKNNNKQIMALQSKINALEKSENFNKITDVKAESDLSLFPTETRVVINTKVEEIRQPGLEQLVASLVVQPGYGIRIFTAETLMLPEQDKRYGTELESISEFKNSKLTYGLYVPVTNFLYPKNVYDPTLPLDALTQEGGWIDKNTVTGQLAGYSPKFQYINSFINARRDKRHVIYCQNLERYGIDMLVAILRTSNINPLVATYNFRDAAGRSRGKTSKQHLQAIAAFNKDPKYNVILSNISVMDAGLLDVDYLHFVDIPNFTIFSAYLNKIYHLQFYRIRKPLTIVFHICNRNNGDKSLDGLYQEKLYLEMVEKLNIGIKLS